MFVRNSFATEYKHLIPIFFSSSTLAVRFNQNVFHIQSSFQFHFHFFLLFSNKMKCFLFDWMDMDVDGNVLHFSLVQLLYNKIDDWILILLWISSYFFPLFHHHHHNFFFSCNTQQTEIVAIIHRQSDFITIDKTRYWIHIYWKICRCLQILCLHTLFFLEAPFFLVREYNSQESFIFRAIHAFWKMKRNKIFDTTNVYVCIF